MVKVEAKKQKGPEILPLFALFASTNCVFTLLALQAKPRAEETSRA
jgi:hypothetical protein